MSYEFLNERACLISKYFLVKFGILKNKGYLCIELHNY